jgi:restriction system protein
MWQREIRHDGLNKYRLIKGETEAIVNVRAEMQMRIWNEQWLRNTTAEAKRLEKESRAWAKESKKQLAADQTIELQKALQALDTLLSSSLKPKYTIDWSALKNTSAFPISQPVQPALQTALQEPKIDAPCFIPQLNWFTRLIPPIRHKAEAKALDLFKYAHQEWERAVTESDKLNRTRAEEFKKLYAIWEENKSKWLEDQARSNASIDQAQEEYRSGKPESVTEYCEMVLHNSEYPDGFPSDAVNAIDSIVLNGWVTSTDKAIGKQVTGCVLSVQAVKSEFMDINLGQVEPKACFKKLKGVSAAKLTALQPVRPILQLNKEDKRFISAYGVADTLDNSSNLAAMDWEDFEQLIREVFEKEFSANGGDVKITRASRDGGVDAVAFDPDPIRGGKIIIQAKRYTHTVSVSAVRDLYGTIHNEGANKGILVSTADYGPDAYEFAKGKPITLLSGSELLYLLQKHGHKARIDLQEARLLNAEKEKAQRAGSQASGD